MQRFVGSALATVLGLTVLVGLGAAVSTPAAAAPAVRYSQDWTGDGHPDVVVADSAGRLWAYRGTGSGGFSGRLQVGTGWSGYDSIAVVGDLDGDGHADLVARHRTTGDLFLYPGDGTGLTRPARRIGGGWGVFSQVLAVGDWTSDGAPDLLALRRSDMTLWLYPGDGHGGFGTARQIGSGWQTRTALTAVGDLNGDGHNDVVARDVRTGALWLYRGSGTGGFAGYEQIGTGWNALTAFVGPGDWDGDGRSDLLARTASGDLLLYRGNGAGRLTSPAVRTGTGWNPYWLNGLPTFAASSAAVTAASLPYTYRAGCPVAPASLRRLHVTYLGFDDRAHTGEIVVNAAAAAKVTAVFANLYAARFPVYRMVSVDAYGGSDDRSMAADNTSSFNCRRVSGSSSWSMHAYGLAVDLNTVENPYVVGTQVSPPAGRPFVDRSSYRRGMVVSGDTVVHAFAAQGWQWGGTWSGSKDYQHFSSNGR